MVDRAVKIIFVDDDETFVKTFKREAVKKRILVHHFFTAEEAKNELNLSTEKLYAGIVLDVKGLKDRESKIPDHAYFPKALMELKALCPSLNVYGITGETDSRDDWSETFKELTTIYSKELDDITILLDQIRVDSKQMPHIKLMNIYKSTFEKADKILAQVEQNSLLQALEYKDKGGADIARTLSSLRLVIEAIVKYINSIRPEVVPTEHIEGGVKFRAILRHLKTDNHLSHLNDYIYKVLDTAYTCMSNHGSHLSDSSNYGTCHQPASLNSVRMCTFAVMDLIEWSYGLNEDATN
jgi:hypothetical protein